MASAIPRSDSTKSVSSDAESYRTAGLPSSTENLLQTDSSSYVSVNDSSSSYHTARTGDSASTTDYETPTLHFNDQHDDNGTLSSSSSMSDLSLAETLEPPTDGKISPMAVAVAVTGERSIWKFSSSTKALVVIATCPHIKAREKAKEIVFVTPARNASRRKQLTSVSFSTSIVKKGGEANRRTLLS